MNSSNIIPLRLINQHIAQTHLQSPQHLVAYMSAMQAQDFGMAKWALGLRLPGETNTTIEKAFNEGKILRTHMLRPTWHFVAPADIHWMQELTAHRVIAILRRYYDIFGITATVRRKSKDVMSKALQGGKFMTRTELQDVLKRSKIIAEREKLAHIIMDAELHNILCSGPRIGKQFTYALLEERTPKVKKLLREEALAELTLRYFTSRGPATVKDFVWWSGLTAKDAKEGLAMLGKKVQLEKIDGQEYHFIHGKNIKLPPGAQTTFLMPDYDEYGIAYKDRSAIFDPSKNNKPEKRGGNILFNHMIVIDGIIAGTWQPAIKKTVSVETVPYNKLSNSQKQALSKAVKNYINFFSH